MMEAYKYKDQKEFDKIAKIFMSSILARKHRHVYLSRSNPYRMICSTISPEELFAQIPTIDDVIHIIDTNGHNVIDFWNTQLPFTGHDRFCINISGMKGIRKKCKNDKEIITAEWLTEPETKMRHYIKEVKQGSRIKLEVRPVIWEISEHYFAELENLLMAKVKFVEGSKHNMSFSLQQGLSARSEFGLVSISQPNGFGSGISLPFVDGFNTVSLCEYLKRVKHDSVDLRVGQTGNIVEYYCKCEDDFATTLSTIPAAYFYAEHNVS